MSNHRREKAWRYRLLIFFLAFSLFVPYQSTLYGATSSKEYKLNKEFLKNFGDDFTQILFSPRNWDKGDILSLSAILGGGILLYATDSDIHDWFEGNRDSRSEDFSKVVSFLGHGACLAGLITALYASGEISDDKSLRKTALLSLESWVTSGVIVLGLKTIVGRARPKTGESSHAFHPFSLRSGFHSFPSGHASSAFAVATTIADQSEKTYIDVLSYSLATLVAISRVHDNQHWPSDVFIGSVIGYVVAKKICSLNRGGDSGKLRIGFHFSQQSQVLSVSFFF
ncbi:MAG: phosphatase PAP2 family protein [Candidatus Aminicenantes bacterium]|nr:MAG: phosphatase PAP2 family protein [Candidatus Aminicenantes bacterium]